MSVLLIPPLAGVPVIVRQVILFSDCSGSWNAGDERPHQPDAVAYPYRKVRDAPAARKGAATPTTTCPFAEEVRSRYIAQSTRGVVVNITAYSPVNSQGYEMECIVTVGDGSQVRGVECSGQLVANVQH
jgi:hypothetical protein